MPLLNDADAIYHGATAVDAVYLGAEKVWPQAAPTVGFHYRYDTDSQNINYVPDPGNWHWNGGRGGYLIVADVDADGSDRRTDWHQLVVGAAITIDAGAAGTFTVHVRSVDKGRTGCGIRSNGVCDRS